MVVIVIYIYIKKALLQNILNFSQKEKNPILFM